MRSECDAVSKFNDIGSSAHENVCYLEITCNLDSKHHIKISAIEISVLKISDLALVRLYALNSARLCDVLQNHPQKASKTEAGLQCF